MRKEILEIKNLVKSIQLTRAVPVGNQSIGGKAFAVIAGPCSIESERQLQEVAGFVQKEGATFLRGGIYKLRTNPRSFQGLGEEAFGIVKRVRAEFKMPLVSEVTDLRQIEELSEIVDLFQVGTRNMYNYALLKELGKQKKPVLLKRGFSALIEEWLLAADYIVREGNENVILCERGIRTFERATRNTLDLSAVAYAKQHSPYPVIVDPSHGVGRSDLVIPMSLAAAAAGADGLLLEVHPLPAQALSDGAQALTFEDFSSLMGQLEKLLKIFDRPLKEVASDHSQDSSRHPPNVRLHSSQL